MIKGHNEDVLYEHSLDHHLEFFSKAGSLFSGKRGRKSYAPYGEKSETTALALFQSMWIIPGLEPKMDAMRLLFWLRDPRGGAGNRSGFRDCLTWLATDAPEGSVWLAANLNMVPEYGRFDDLASLFNSSLEKSTAKLWAEQISAGNHYALKWAKRNMVPLQRAFGTNEAGLRKQLRQPARATVETAMCSRNWREINYAHVPSVAMARYTKAFGKHDPEGFESFKSKLEKGEATVNAATLFPHDCLRTARSGDSRIADQQFAAMPDYIPVTERRIMGLVDVSASMNSSVSSGSISCKDVAMSLGLYCSDRVGEGNPFYRKYMEFSTEPTFVDWQNNTFSESCHPHGNYMGSTNIEACLRYILSVGQMFSATRDQMINTLLILSDMQFDQHTQGQDPTGQMTYCGYGVACTGTDRTVVEKVMADWEAAGYERPSIVYWNLAGYAGQPATLQTPNTGLVSGFSPSILSAVLGGENFDPLSVMRRAISKYEIQAPA
jgi:hypothetical protein